MIRLKPMRHRSTQGDPARTSAKVASVMVTRMAPRTIEAPRLCSCVIGQFEAPGRGAWFGKPSPSTGLREEPAETSVGVCGRAPTPSKPILVGALGLLRLGGNGRLHLRLSQLWRTRFGLLGDPDFIGRSFGRLLGAGAHLEGCHG